MKPFSARFAAYAVLGLWCLLAAGAALIPLQPQAVHLEKILLAPGGEAWLGYDELGRQIGDRLLFALRTSLAVVLGVVPIAAALGTAAGMLAAWMGGVWDLACARIIDVFLAFPGILLAIALAALLGPGIGNVVVALVVVGWVGYARLARAQTLALRGREHIQAAQLMGTSSARMLLMHVLPLIAAPLIVETAFAVAGVILAEAGLAFLGLGAQPPAASLGGMIRDGSAYMLVAPHMIIIPGMALFAIVLSINVAGEALRRRLQSRGRYRREP